MKRKYLRIISDKGLVTRIYIKLLQLNNKRMNEPTYEWVKHLNRHSPKKIHK